MLYTQGRTAAISDSLFAASLPAVIVLHRVSYMASLVNETVANPTTAHGSVLFNERSMYPVPGRSGNHSDLMLLLRASHSSPQLWASRCTLPELPRPRQSRLPTSYTCKSGTGAYDYEQPTLQTFIPEGNRAANDQVMTRVCPCGDLSYAITHRIEHHVSQLQISRFGRTQILHHRPGSTHSLNTSSSLCYSRQR